MIIIYVLLFWVLENIILLSAYIVVQKVWCQNTFLLQMQHTVMLTNKHLLTNKFSFEYVLWEFKLVIPTVKWLSYFSSKSYILPRASQYSICANLDSKKKFKFLIYYFGVHILLLSVISLLTNKPCNTNLCYCP
jgi:hypothetical protein